MKAQTDKLFREKLADHSLEAPPMAWGKIESALPKKNNSFFWLKIAASFVLLIAAAVLLWPREQQAPFMADHNKPTEKAIGNKQNEKEKSEKDKTEKETQQTEKAKSDAVEKEGKTENKKSAKPNNKPAQQKTSAPVMNFSKQESFLAINDTREPEKETHIAKENNATLKIDQQTEIATTEPVATTTSNQQSTTIVLAANDVSKYLKNPAVADATTEEENTSSFRKLLDKASDLKNSESGLSELRQKKNEILALNFRNDKRERNN